MSGTRNAIITGAAVLAMVPLLLSCSVKEDRIGCPSYVNVNVDMFIAAGMSEGRILNDSDDRIDNESVSFMSCIGDGYGLQVERSRFNCAVVSGLTRSSAFHGYHLYTPARHEADPVFAYAAPQLFTGDGGVIRAVPHKQYCKVSFALEDHDPAGYPFVYRITCLNNGIDCYTLLPEPGEYVWVVQPNVLGEFSTILLRQKPEDRIMMEVVFPDSDSVWSGETVYTVDLGRRILEAGYDWLAEDLDDVTVKVGFSSAEVQVTVEDWTPDGRYDGQVM